MLKFDHSNARCMNAKYMGLIGFCLFSMMGGQAQADSSVKTESVEVHLNQVFVPREGYGSNNNIQLTLDGYLPNSCYQIGNAKVELSADRHTLIVRQFANKETEGLCAEDSGLPVHLANVVPFTYDVSVGHLPAGDYNVVFNQSFGDTRKRAFHVYASKNLTVDDYPYAAVSSVAIPDVVSSLSPLSVDLTGSFTSTCSYVADIKVSYVDDMVVVQPILGHKPGVVCSQMLVPFSKKLPLGQLPEGRYLVHVRTMSGNSMSHAFSVARPDLAK